MARCVLHRGLVRLARRVVLEGDQPGARAGALLVDGHGYRVARCDRQRYLARRLRQHLDPRLELRLAATGCDVLCSSLDQVAALDTADADPGGTHAGRAVGRQLGNGPGARDAGIVLATGRGVAGPVVRGTPRAWRD